MKVIQNVSVSVQQFHDAWLETIYHEEALTVGTKFIYQNVLYQILACSKHHIQMVSSYPEGEKYIDIQLDAINPSMTIVEINECFESKQLKIQLLAWGYELFYQIKFKRMKRDEISKIEEKIREKKNNC